MVCREEEAASDAPGSLRDRQTDRQTGGETNRQGVCRETEAKTTDVSPWAGMSIMAYGSVREITSCMMMEKLKKSPANVPPRTGFLKSSGAVHSSSERQEDRQTDRKGETVRYREK